MLYDSTHTGARRGKFAETGGRMPGAGLNGCRVSVWDEQKVLEMDGVMAALHYECA